MIMESEETVMEKPWNLLTKFVGTLLSEYISIYDMWLPHETASSELRPLSQ